MIQFSWEAQDVSQAARTMLFEAWLRHDSHETAQAGCHKTLNTGKSAPFSHMPRAWSHQDVYKSCPSFHKLQATGDTWYCDCACSNSLFCFFFRKRWVSSQGPECPCPCAGGRGIAFSPHLFEKRHLMFRSHPFCQFALKSKVLSAPTKQTCIKTINCHQASSYPVRAGDAFLPRASSFRFLSQDQQETSEPHNLTRALRQITLASLYPSLLRALSGPFGRSWLKSLAMDHARETPLEFPRKKTHKKSIIYQ